MSSSVSPPSSLFNTSTTSTTTSTLTTINHNRTLNSTPKVPPLGLAQHDSLEWSRRDSVEASRHKTEFIIYKKLGQGGFGSAHQVRNRVDSQLYCLKRIPLNKLVGKNGNTTTMTTPTNKHATSEGKDKVLREVQVLSSLHSDHVVRYYSAWVEKGEQVLHNDHHDHDDDDDDGCDSDNDESNEWTLSHSDNSSSSSSSSLREQSFPVCHLCQETYTEWEVSFEHWGLIDAVLQPLDLCIPCYKKSIPGNEIPDIEIRQTRILRDYLFILMEYCEQTLQEAVQNVDSTTKWNYFCQCVQGVAHLHSKGVIHRDIKPNNIFVHKGVVKIGDLGLATIVNNSAGNGDAIPSSTTTSSSLLEADQTTDQTSTDEALSKSTQVGTFLYTAPEVATGRYNEKCDTYSLGIVLVEMFSTFTTNMERALVLGSGLARLPNDWIHKYPVQTQVARHMASPSPDDRPTCSQVLGDLIGRGLYEKRNVEALVATLTDQVARLEADLEHSRLESMRFQKLLESNGIPF